MSPYLPKIINAKNVLHLLLVIAKQGSQICVANQNMGERTPISHPGIPFCLVKSEKLPNCVHPVT
jgi:hypothetical protein